MGIDRVQIFWAYKRRRKWPVPNGIEDLPVLPVAGFWEGVPGFYSQIPRVIA